MAYIDGFVAAVPSEKKQAYIDMAKEMSQVFLASGALSVVENWGDDVPEGKLTSFTMAVQRQEDESIVFSWITWPSREARDAGWKTAMEDERMKMDSGIFDGKRMIFGGFQTILEA